MQYRKCVQEFNNTLQLKIKSVFCCAKYAPVTVQYPKKKIYIDAWSFEGIENVL